MKLEVIIASTRPGRLGDQIGKWFADYAATHSDFEVSVADLAEINLPLFNEAAHPMTGVYAHDHTKAWSKRIASADAFVVITPEYNYTMPPALMNAIDYLNREWKYKPVGFVGYGIAGGVRAVQAEKLIFANLSAMPVGPTVSLMGVHRPATETYVPEERHEQAADKMLAELTLWAEALQGMRSRVVS